MGAKISKEALCEEARFILANVLAESRYGKKHRYSDIGKVCDGAISLPFKEYIDFLEQHGYLRYERKTKLLRISTQGESVVNGGGLAQLSSNVSAHFKQIIASSSTSSKVSKSSSKSYPSSSSSGSSKRDNGLGIVDRYDKLATIGNGGVGTVYRARHIPLGREVALKEIKDIFDLFVPEQHEEIRRRFAEAIAQAASVSHPNINPIFDVCIDAEFPFIVSELSPSGSLRRILNESDEVPVATTMRYLLQSLHGLRAAHESRVYHRGLKPEQILIDAHDNVRISDFALTKIVEQDASNVRQVYVGQGNIAYMAPEFYTDPSGLSAPADIYSLGIIFYELLTRRVPGRRSPMPSSINRQVPTELDDIFDKMTRDSRAERYASVEEILEDLDKLDGLNEILGQQTLLAVSENPLEPLAGDKVESIAEQLEPENTSLDTPQLTVDDELDEFSKEIDDALDAAN